MKTAKSRRTLELPNRCVEALRDHKAEQTKIRARQANPGMSLAWRSAYGTGRHSTQPNVRRSFRLVARLGSTPRNGRELRHSFVSLLSSSGLTIEEIAHFVGHGSTSVTERVYRKELRPVITRGAARHQRALRWRGQAIGGQLGRQVNDPTAARAGKIPKRVAD
jgi:integrase